MLRYYGYEVFILRRLIMHNTSFTYKEYFIDIPQIMIFFPPFSYIKVVGVTIKVVL